MLKVPQSKGDVGASGGLGGHQHFHCGWYAVREEPSCLQPVLGTCLWSAHEFCGPCMSLLAKRQGLDSSQGRTQAAPVWIRPLLASDVRLVPAHVQTWPGPSLAPSGLISQSKDTIKSMYNTSAFAQCFPIHEHTPH